MAVGVAQATAAAVNATQASVADHKQLVRHINDLQTQLQNFQHVSKRVPIAFGNILSKVTFTSGVTQYLAHGLGRAYKGYLITAAYTPASGTLIVTSLPSGKTADKYIGLVSAVNGTFDVYVF